MFASAFDLTGLIPFAVFGAFSAVVWLIADRLWRRRGKVEERLDRLDRDNRNQPHDRPIGRVSSAMSDLMERATPRLAKPLQPTNAKDESKLRQRLSAAGFRSELAPTTFLALKVVCLAAGYFLGGGAMLFVTGFTPAALMRVALAAGLAFYLPDVLLWLLTKRRHQQIFLGLPDAIDMIVVCVESGLGLDQAMRKVAVELKKAYPVVAHEFEIANMQLQMGVDRVHALRDMGQRNGEDSLQGLGSVLVQASRFGSAIGEALRVHSDAMRIRRRQLAEEKAAKCTVKLIFPLVLFIFPGIFVVLVGPAAISIVEYLMPIMTGG
jgi:tight adherence protein C